MTESGPFERLAINRTTPPSVGMRAKLAAWLEAPEVRHRGAAVSRRASWQRSRNHREHNHRLWGHLSFACFILFMLTRKMNAGSLTIA